MQDNPFVFGRPSAVMVLVWKSEKMEEHSQIIQIVVRKVFWIDWRTIKFLYIQLYAR